MSVVVRTNRSELVRGGHVIAQHGCWTLLKGGIVANFSSSAEIIFEVICDVFHKPVRINNKIYNCNESF